MYLEEKSTDRLLIRKIEMKDHSYIAVFFCDDNAVKYIPSRENRFGLMSLINKITGDYTGQC